MSLVINTNVASLDAQRNLSSNTLSLQKDFQQLSSGFRINRAADDAAGLQISQNLEAQIRGVGQAINNAQDGNNLLSVAEGTLSTVQDSLQRIRELTVQAANGTNGTAQLTAIKQEIDARISDISRITQASQFNGISLLKGNLSVGSLRLQVGANGSKNLDTINVASALGSATATTLGIKTSTNMLVSNQSAEKFLGSVDKALTEVSRRRALIGALQNQLSSAISNLQTTSENFSASESQIMDVNVASVSADLAKNQILQQASASILAQANQTPQLALKLIG